MRKISLLVTFLLFVSVVSAIGWPITGLQIKAGPQTPPPPPPPGAMPAAGPVELCPQPTCPQTTGVCNAFLAGQRCPYPFVDWGLLQYPLDFPAKCPRNAGVCCCTGEKLAPIVAPIVASGAISAACISPGQESPSPSLACPKFCDLQGQSTPAGVGEARKVCRVKSNLIHQPVPFGERLTKCRGDMSLGFRTEACTCRAEPVSAPCPSECPLFGMPSNIPSTLGLIPNVIPNFQGPFLCVVDLDLRGRQVPCAGYERFSSAARPIAPPSGPSPEFLALQAGAIGGRAIPCFCRSPAPTLPACPSGVTPLAPSRPILPTVGRVAPELAGLPKTATDEEVCKRMNMFVPPTCEEKCSPKQVCKETGFDFFERRVRCYNCVAKPKEIAIPKGVTPPPTPTRVKEVLWPFGNLGECKKVQTFSKFQLGGESCENKCPSDMECRVVDVCAGAPARCPGGKKDCAREKKLCDGKWVTCFNCERKMQLIGVKVTEKGEVVVGPVKAEKVVIKAEIPTEVIGICNEAAKQFSESFASVISPPKPEGCASGCRLVKFNVPGGSAKCCCCGQCKPIQPVVKAPTVAKPTPEAVCADVQQRVIAQGAPYKVSVAEGMFCPSGCQMQDLKIAQCCLCKI